MKIFLKDLQILPVCTRDVYLSEIAKTVEDKKRPKKRI